MKNQILTIMGAITVLLLIGCGGGGDSKDKKYTCPSEPLELSEMMVGDHIDSPALDELFSSVEPSVFESGDYCSKNYIFKEFNDDTFEWCYYYSVDVTCDTNTITSIYTDPQ